MRKPTPFEARLEAVASSLRVFRPPGSGPFPAVVQLHGCGGVSPNQETWAHAIVETGAAAVILDSYAFRGLTRNQALASVCTGLRLHGRERAGDLAAALEWLRRADWADAARLAVVGWSHGGWTALDALALRPSQWAPATGLADLPERPLAGVRGVFAFYPYLGRASLARAQGLCAPIPVTAIVCGRDRTVGFGLPKDTLQRCRARGAMIEIVEYSAATHDFDEPGLKSPWDRYDPTLAADANARLQRFVRNQLGLDEAHSLTTNAGS